MKANTLTPEQRAFRPIHERGDIVAGVQLARSGLRCDLLKRGVDYDAPELAAKLAGPIRRSDTGMEWNSFCEQVYAAMVLGIALGQLVHPDVFTKDRA
jgi:hypothetical protein